MIGTVVFQALQRICVTEAQRQAWGRGGPIGAVPFRYLLFRPPPEEERSDHRNRQEPAWQSEL